MDEIAVRHGIHELIAAYAECIDDDRLEEWPDFFVEKCRYLITSRRATRPGYRHGVVYCASKGMLNDRVTTLRRAKMFEPHRYRHIIGPTRVGKVDGRGGRDAIELSSRSGSCTTARPACSPPAAISTASTVGRALPFHRAPRRPRQPEDRHPPGDPALNPLVSGPPLRHAQSLRKREFAAHAAAATAKTH